MEYRYGSHTVASPTDFKREPLQLQMPAKFSPDMLMLTHAELLTDVTIQL